MGSRTIVLVLLLLFTLTLLSSGQLLSGQLVELPPLDFAAASFPSYQGVSETEQASLSVAHFAENV